MSGAFKPVNTLDKSRNSERSGPTSAIRPRGQEQRLPLKLQRDLGQGHAGLRRKRERDGNAEEIRHKKARVDPGMDGSSQDDLAVDNPSGSVHRASVFGSRDITKGSARTKSQHLTPMGSLNEYRELEDMLRPSRSTSRAATSPSSSTRTLASEGMHVSKVMGKGSADSNGEQVKGLFTTNDGRSDDDPAWVKPNTSAKKYHGRRADSTIAEAASPSIEEIIDSADEKRQKQPRKPNLGERRALSMMKVGSTLPNGDPASPTTETNRPAQKTNNLRYQFARVDESDKDELAISSPPEQAFLGSVGSSLSKKTPPPKSDPPEPTSMHTGPPHVARGTLSKSRAGFALVAFYSQSWNVPLEKDPSVQALIVNQENRTTVTVRRHSKRQSFVMHDMEAVFTSSDNYRIHFQSKATNGKALTYAHLHFESRNWYQSFLDKLTLMAEDFHLRPKSREQLNKILGNAQQGKPEAVKHKKSLSHRVVDLARTSTGAPRLSAREHDRRRLKETSPSIVFEEISVKHEDQKASAEGPNTRRRATNIAHDVTSNGTSRPRTPSSLAKYSEHHDLGPAWRKPLVYPRTGPGKATVVWKDLYRLDEEDYLNDNIISFCLRYAQQMSEKTSKRVHVFNSFFYDTLTKDIPKGQNINYEAVRRWTTKSKLFDNYDYIVVPINQNFHWYAAIICNLPALLAHPAAEADPVDGKQQLPEANPVSKVEENSTVIDNGGDLVAANAANHKESVPEPTTPNHVEIPSPRSPKQTSEIRPSTPQREAGSAVAPTMPLNEDSRASHDAPDVSDGPAVDTPGATLALDTARMSISETDECDHETSIPEASQPFTQTEYGEEVLPPQEVPSSVLDEIAEEQLEDHEPQVQHTLKRSSKKKPPQPIIRKRDPDEPIIIVLDSLHSTHSAVVRKLKDYLEAEAKDKVSKEVCQPPKVVNEKAIPGQNNFSDCGVYLVGYIAKFLEDPAGFVSRQACGELSADPDWLRLQPAVIRDNVRSIIRNEYLIQKAEGKKSRDPAAVAASRDHPPRLATAYKEFTELPSEPMTTPVHRNQDKDAEADNNVTLLPSPPPGEDSIVELKEAPGTSVSSGSGLMAGLVDAARPSRGPSSEAAPNADDFDEIAGSQSHAAVRSSNSDALTNVPDLIRPPRTPSPERLTRAVRSSQSSQPELATVHMPSHSAKPTTKVITIADSQEAESPHAMHGTRAVQSNGRAPSAKPSLESSERHRLPSPVRRARIFAKTRPDHDPFVVDQEDTSPSRQDQSRKRLRTPDTFESPERSQGGASATSPPDRSRRHKHQKMSSPERPVTRGK